MYMISFHVYKRGLNVRTGNAVALPVGSNMATTARRMFVFGCADLRKSP